MSFLLASLLGRLVTRKMVPDELSHENGLRKLFTRKMVYCRTVVTGKMILEALSQKKWF